jgi:hypothetical protein
MEQAELDALARQNADSYKRQADNGAAMLAAFKAQTALLSTPAQEHWLRLYEIHTKLRLGPTVITTGTGDTVMDDICRDAFRMTTLVWDQVRGELDKLA